jgi:hypothetical protein
MLPSPLMGGWGAASLVEAGSGAAAMMAGAWHNMSQQARKMQYFVREFRIKLQNLEHSFELLS